MLKEAEISLHPTELFENKKVDIVAAQSMVYISSVFMIFILIY